MIASPLLIVAGTASYLVGFYVWLSGRSRPGTVLQTCGSWISFVGAVTGDAPISMAIFGCLAAMWTWLWWRDRRNGRGRRAARALGAKSRARITALVRQMTPSPIPVPAGGAR